MEKGVGEDDLIFILNNFCPGSYFGKGKKIK